MESPFGTALGWLLVGVFLGWLGNWLFDRLYRRDGPAAGELSALRLEGLTGEIDALRAELSELREDMASLRSAPLASAGPPDAQPPTDAGAATLSPMEILARRAAGPVRPLWSIDEDRAAQARLEALRDFQTPGAAPASSS